MKTVKTWLMNLDYDKTNWLMILNEETHQTETIKISKKEFDKLHSFGIPTTTEILTQNGVPT